MHNEANCQQEAMLNNQVEVSKKYMANWRVQRYVLV